MATIFRHVRGEAICDGLEEITRRTADMYGKEIEECSFCGSSNATAYWRGCCDEPIRVCLTCAVDVLPALAADAIVAENIQAPNKVMTLQRWWMEVMTAKYWRACCIAMERVHHAIERNRR